MHDPSDADLVARTLAGDRSAFGQLYDRYARLVRATVFDSVHDVEAMHDLTQECFLRAFRKLATLRDRERFGAWVVGIARQLVLEQRRQRRSKPLDAETLAATNGASPLGDEEECARVRKLVGRLPEVERLAVQFFYLQEQDVEETARLLNLSRSGTYAVLKRACTRLARWLGLPERQKEETP